jgi:hypothetical protein
MRQDGPYVSISVMYLMIWSDANLSYEVYPIYGTPNMRKEWENEEILGAFMKQKHFISYFQIFLDKSLLTKEFFRWIVFRQL